MARERPQIQLELAQLRVEQVNDLERGIDPLERVDGQLEGGEELAAGQGPQFIGGAGDAVVIERRARTASERPCCPDAL